MFSVHIALLGERNESIGSSEQFLLEVSGGDYINVPANAEHWFEMRGCTRCKAVRYFIDTSGWTPLYTGRARVFAAAAATA